MIVVVDYAHTPDALARVLDSVKSVAGRRAKIKPTPGSNDWALAISVDG